MERIYMRCFSVEKRGFCLGFYQKTMKRPYNNDDQKIKAFNKIILSMMLFFIFGLSIEAKCQNPTRITLSNLEKNTNGIISRYSVTNHSEGIANCVHEFYYNNGGILFLVLLDTLGPSETKK